MSIPKDAYALSNRDIDIVKIFPTYRINKYSDDTFLYISTFMKSMREIQKYLNLGDTSLLNTVNSTVKMYESALIEVKTNALKQCEQLRNMIHDRERELIKTYTEKGYPKIDKLRTEVDQCKLKYDELPASIRK